MKEITLADIETAIQIGRRHGAQERAIFLRARLLRGRRRLRRVARDRLPRRRAGLEGSRPKLDRRVPAEDQHDHHEERRRLLRPDLGHRLHARRRAEQGPHEHHARGPRQDAHGGHRGHPETRRRATGRQDPARRRDPDPRASCTKARATDDGPARSAASGDGDGERGDRAHQAWVAKRGRAAVHGRPQREHARSGHRRDRDDAATTSAPNSACSRAEPRPT